MNSLPGIGKVYRMGAMDDGMIYLAGRTQQGRRRLKKLRIKNIH